ncbi:hypothetical protein HNQ39_000028 [Armatimonas rosea]|uniref:Uncharacterized protein n=1 Tax=Armatimonas rosea TaxID=685828 RepID=A0A7W9SKF6_ARMRO|nr:hypothetical protein [Armatimonas rosea]
MHLYLEEIHSGQFICADRACTNDQVMQLPEKLHHLIVFHQPTKELSGSLRLPTCPW